MNDYFRNLKTKITIINKTKVDRDYKFIFDGSCFTIEFRHEILSKNIKEGYTFTHKTLPYSSKNELRKLLERFESVAMNNRTARQRYNIMLQIIKDVNLVGRKIKFNKILNG